MATRTFYGSSLAPENKENQPRNKPNVSKWSACAYRKVGSKSHCRAVPAVPSPIWCRRDVPVGVPLDLSTPTGMSCIGTYGENCKSDNLSEYRGLLVAFLLLWHEN